VTKNQNVLEPILTVIGARNVAILADTPKGQEDRSRRVCAAGSNVPLLGLDAGEREGDLAAAALRC
jgi:hypothetical protein